MKGSLSLQPGAMIHNSASSSTMKSRCLACPLEPEMKDQQRELNVRPHVTTPHRVRIRSGMLLGALIVAMICWPGGGWLVGKEKPPIQYQISIPTPPDFSALDWLQGRWSGKTISNGVPGEVQLSITPDLEKHFLIFRGEVSLAATPNVPATKESWMGILSASPDHSGFILRMYSSRGFMTRYRMTVDEPEVRLDPEGGDNPPPGWLFRRIWARTGPDEITETVQAAPPGKAFFDWYAAKLTRLPPPPTKDTPAKAAPAPTTAPPPAP